MAIPMQASYPTAFLKGVPGQIANEEKYNGLSRTVETAAGIPFGQPAFRGSNDHGVIAGAAFAATAVATANAGNTGNATSSVPVVSAGAAAGAYVVSFISATAYNVTNAATGAFVGRGATGVAFNTGGLSFTITAGGTPMVAGDGFTIAVTYTTNVAFVGIAVATFSPEGAATGSTLLADGYSFNTTGTFGNSGSFYVLAGASVNDGDPVYWNSATGRYTNTNTQIRLPGTYFDTTGVNGDTVEISLGNRRVLV